MTINKELELLAREMSINVHKSEHGKEKAEIWICGDILLPNGAKAKCEECGKICYYDTKLSSKFFTTKHIKICTKCAYENHFDEMTALEQEIFTDFAIKNKWKLK